MLLLELEDTNLQGPPKSHIVGRGILADQTPPTACVSLSSRSKCKNSNTHTLTKLSAIPVTVEEGY
jgi:hypothetical protein